jgi:hypothetical protein
MNEFFNFIRAEADALEAKKEEFHKSRTELNKIIRIIKEIMIKANKYQEDNQTSRSESDLLFKFKSYVATLDASPP